MFSKETFRYAAEIDRVRQESDKPFTGLDPVTAVRQLEQHCAGRLRKEFFLSEAEARKVLEQVKRKFKKITTRLDALLVMNAFMTVQVEEAQAQADAARARGDEVLELTTAEKKTRAKGFMGQFKVRRQRA